MDRVKRNLAQPPTVPPKGMLIVLVCLLSACAPVAPHWEAQFGNSVKQAAALQTMNPDASRNSDPVVGMDGRSANEGVKRYYKSFQEPPPPPALFRVITNSGQ